jgi:hypothetical protein
VLGRTEDAQLRQRTAAVLSSLLALPRWQSLLDGADAIVARQLETLVPAAIARRLRAPAAPLIFECLDIHRLMGAPGAVGGMLRGLERRLLAGCQGLMVSSPDFIGAHFARAHATLPPVILVENKVFEGELDDRAAAARARKAPRRPGAPWRIGWNGIIRCARSLRLLADLAAARPGAVEVVVRGRIAAALADEFAATVAATPGLTFEGPYDRRRELAGLYGAVHFAWAVDFSEDGANSNWLLPNRLYEAALFGAVPIARAEVAAGRWLARRGIGALLAGDPAAALDALLGGMDAARYGAMAGALAGLPESAFLYTTADCERLVERLTAAKPVADEARRPAWPLASMPLD